MPQTATALRTTMLAIAAAVAAIASASASAQVEIDTEWVLESDAAHPGTTIHAALGVKIEEGWHVNADKPLEDFLIPTTLTLTPAAGITVRDIVYPQPIMLKTELGDQMAVFENEFVIWIALDVAETVAPGTYPIQSRLRYQACDDTRCIAPEMLEFEPVLKVAPATEPVAEVDMLVFGWPVFPPQPGPADATAATPQTPSAPIPAADCDVMAEMENFELLGATGGYLDEQAFLQFVDDAEAGATPRGLFEGRGLLTIILLIILGGIALNLTPCVLPLIPINLAIIGAGTQAGSRMRGFALGGTYGLAMAAVYGVLGLVVILVTDQSFGTINSTIWFNLAIAILFVVLALAMFDIIHIDFSKYQGKLNVSRIAKQGTFVLAFFMGGITALLAGACVAPVVIQVIVYSGDLYAKGAKIALALPFLLGVGLALPWPLAGAGISCLPKPGMWMVRVKQALGLFILVFAGYYGYLAWEIFDHQRAAAAPGHAPLAQTEEGWTDSICEGLATARSEDRLVLVDMWATWCKNCFVMDRTTFKDDAVVDRLEDYVKIKFQAEDLKTSPAKELIERFEGIGLPTYAILRPKRRPQDAPDE